MDKQATKRHLEDGDSKERSQKNDQDEKLIKLIGGKKAKNSKATSKWMEKTCSKDQESKINADLEKQFNSSLQNKLSGNTRKHTGIGFHDDTEQPRQNTIIKFADSDDEESEKIEKKIEPKIKENISKPEAKSPVKPLIKTKKDFYSQFTKASS